jgi:hypothetical protein
VTTPVEAIVEAATPEEAAVLKVEVLAGEQALTVTVLEMLLVCWTPNAARDVLTPERRQRQP